MQSKTLAYFAIAVGLLGCSGGEIGIKSDLKPQSFAVGVATKSEVTNAIGLPQRIDTDEAGNQHLYYEKSARLAGMCLGCGNVSNTAGLIPAAAVEGSKSKAQSNAIEFVFDPAGILMLTRGTAGP